ncbi:hypothetical protein [Siphonobacter sp. BAB-5385]|uniref:hypothetical protein n=1 Tax=Siphonobacter sp. BAB-5385 TaxID=1864822 RepID=UPI00114081E0|nr:hypothetical protein [Siphonobacter sp. BAB-5385]
MKKTISITIAGVVFYIEEDGYDRLQGYLESIKRYFSSYEAVPKSSRTLKPVSPKNSTRRSKKTKNEPSLPRMSRS